MITGDSSAQKRIIN